MVRTAVRTIVCALEGVEEADGYVRWRRGGDDDDNVMCLGADAIIASRSLRLKTLTTMALCAVVYASEGAKEAEVGWTMDAWR